MKNERSTVHPCHVKTATFAPALNSYFLPFTNSVPNTSPNPFFNLNSYLRNFTSNVTFSFLLSTSKRSSQSGSNLNSCVVDFSSDIQNFRQKIPKLDRNISKLNYQSYDYFLQLEMFKE
ncbi:hypothetical protein V1477_009027 [Vespula maculifrons]|uniref:Uncharacterized protein n=1 Tax=Vespula maculifrons TaxID=7453 RepID=A0ABD2CH19_VESMC